MNKNEPTNTGQTATQQQAATIQAEFLYLTVKQFVEQNKAFKLGGIRALIFNEHQNGLAKSGAIVRMGRKVLIRRELFFNWIESQNQGGAK